jgi:selenocysteine lyase/cysteine desulfurase
MSHSAKPLSDYSDFREQFPSLEQGLYLNHAAIAPWPRCTTDAVVRFAEENRSAGPAAYRDWILREKDLRGQLASITGADSADDIALLKNTTEGISLVAWGLDWKPGDNIVLPVGEFPSNRLPWLAQSARGVTVREVDIRGAENAENALLDAMDERTRLLSVSAVQWNDGFRLDLSRLGRACRSAHVLFFVDAIQQLGALPLDVEKSHIDFLAADAHKWLLGPEGIAVFYCRTDARPHLQLLQQGWHMVDNPWNFHQQEWQPSQSARRFEAGSPNTLGQVAMQASVELLLNIGLKTIARRVLLNSDFLIKQLPKLEGIVVSNRTSPDRRSGIVSFKHRNIKAGSLNSRLARAGITVAVRGDSIRISPHFYQDESDLANFLDVLAESIKAN